MIVIGKSFHFDAAHQHPHSGAGKCHRLHGHTYRVEVRLSGRVRQDAGPEQGMIVDLGRVAAWWASMDELLDHTNLNETMPPAYLPSTIENLAQWLLDDLGHTFGELAHSVRVQEGETQWAIASA